MSKICSSCHAENRDEAQFCRACGTAFGAAEPAAADTGLTCFECGYANPPGVRYCAKCGVNLMGSVVVPRSKAQTQASAATSGYPPAFDPQPIPDVPDVDTVIDVEREQAHAASPSPAAIGFGIEPPPKAPNRTGLWAGIGIAVIVAAVVAWWFLDTSPSQPPPAAATTPAAAAPAAPMPPAPADTAAAAKTAEAAAPAIAASGAIVEAPPVAVPTPPAPVEATAAPAANEAQATDAQRVADEKATAAKAARDKAARERMARDKAAREKAERDAKAKAESDQREQATARQKAEQDAAARKRAEDQRARSQPAPAPVAQQPQTKSARDLCAGRNPISQAICESRTCGAPEHANEPLCRQIRANEDRRRDPT